MEGVPQPKVGAVDEAIFPIIKIASPEVISNVAPVSVEKAREAFLNDPTQDPVFEYDQNKLLDLDRKEIQLLDLKLEIKATNRVSGIPEGVQQMYLWTINEQLAKIRLLRETFQVELDGKVEYHARRFQRYNEFIYGKPNEIIFGNVIEVLRNKLSGYGPTANEAVAEAVGRLMFLVGGAHTRLDREASLAINTPDTQRVEQSTEVVTDPEELKTIFEDALQGLGLTAWKVAVDKTGKRKAIAVLKKSKRIALPAAEALSERTKDRALTVERIKGLIRHEIETHALRAEHGYKQPIQLFELGFDRYEKGEEGLATYREQQEAGFTDFSGFDAYFAAGLAYGLDSGNKRDFKEVFAILKDYYLAFSTPDEKRAAIQAWNRCQRLFRGTKGVVPGVIFTKDILYREGNIATWHLMQNGTPADIILNFGKYDPTNPRHVQLLVELGLTDERLQALDEEDL